MPTRREKQEQRQKALAVRQAAKKHQRDLRRSRRLGEKLAARKRGEDAPPVSDKLVRLPSVSDKSELPSGVYLTLAEAQAALAEEREQERSLGSIATGLAIGLGAVAILGLGVVIVYLLFRKDESMAAPRLEREIIREIPSPSSYSLAPPSQLQPVRNRSFGYHYEDSDEEEALAPRRTRQEAHVRTVTLPGPTDQAIRLVNATDVPYRATVRVVNPPGSYAVLAFNPTELNLTLLPIIPTGDTLIMPSGDQQEFRLSARQAIFAKGSTTGVVVSVLAAEAGDGG